MVWGNDGWHRTLERFLPRLFGLGRSRLGCGSGLIGDGKADQAAAGADV
jgi:hypothetical protein